MSEVITPAHVAASLSELWSPRIVAEVDDVYIKVARVHGEFVWHDHADEDELFYILKGSLRILLESGEVILNEGQLFVVPKGVRHCPIATDECHLLLIERKTTQHTGAEVVAITRSIEEQKRG